MQTITIKPTGEQKVFHDYFKPFICTSDIDLPKMYNQGYNCFRFVGGEPDFIGLDMPEVLKMETNNYTFFECQIQVLRSNGTAVTGHYYKTITKETGEAKQTFSFD